MTRSSSRNAPILSPAVAPNPRNSKPSPNRIRRIVPKRPTPSLRAEPAIQAAQTAVRCDPDLVLVNEVQAILPVRRIGILLVRHRPMGPRPHRGKPVFDRTPIRMTHRLDEAPDLKARRPNSRRRPADTAPKAAPGPGAPDVRPPASARRGPRPAAPRPCNTVSLSRAAPNSQASDLA
jgi:hypothetical protein